MLLDTEELAEILQKVDVEASNALSSHLMSLDIKIGQLIESRENWKAKYMALKQKGLT